MNKFFEFSNGAKGALSFRDDGQPMFVLSDVPGLPGRAEYYATQWLDVAARQRGIKVVASDRVCVDRAKFEAVLMLARAAMSDEDTVRKLVWEEE